VQRPGEAPRHGRALAEANLKRMLTDLYRTRKLDVKISKSIDDLGMDTVARTFAEAVRACVRSHWLAAPARKLAWQKWWCCCYWLPCVVVLLRL